MVKSKIEGEKYIYEFDEKDRSLANAIRQTILNSVPTMAIEDVEVLVNESPMYDEVLAHRLGLVPLTTDLDSYNFRDECKCGGVGCSLCEVHLSLKQEEHGYVYSGSIKSDDPKVVPADKKIPITKLGEGKKIEVNMKAILGRGREHAKWAPAHSYLRDNEKTKKVELIIEPFGQLESDVIYNKALDIIKEELTELINNME